MLSIKDAVLLATRTLSARCDGARSLDGQGFNGTDTKFGKRLASLPATDVTQSMVDEAAQMLVKYVSQLEAAGLTEVYEQVKAYASTTTGDKAARQDARRATYAEENRTGRVVDVHAGEFVLTVTKYDREGRETIKAEVPGRRFDWDTKVWMAPLSSAPHVQAWAAKTGAKVTEAAQAGFSAPVAVAPVVNDLKVVKIADDEVWLSAPFNAVSVDTWRALPGRRWDSYNKVNKLPLRPSTLAFMAEYGWDGQDDVKAALDARAAVDIAKEQEQENNRLMSKAEDAELVVLDGQSPDWNWFGYQNAGIRQMVKLGDVLLGDEMGVGKTSQAIGAVEMSQEFPAVVVCPPVVRGNWEREWRRIVPGRNILVATGSTPWMVPAHIEVVIVSDASVAEWVPALIEWVGERKGSVIVDEVHRAKHGTLMDGKRASTRAQAVEMLCAQIG